MKALYPDIIQPNKLIERWNRRFLCRYRW